MIPAGDGAPLIRTYFGDEAGWQALVVAALSISPEDGFQAYLYPVDDTAFEGADLAMLVRNTQGRPVAFVADRIAITDSEQPILCLEPIGQGRTLRVIPEVIWAVENNLSIANMDFEEFLDAADADGVLRRF